MLIHIRLRLCATCQFPAFFVVSCLSFHEKVGDRDSHARDLRHLDPLLSTNPLASPRAIALSLFLIIYKSVVSVQSPQPPVKLEERTRIRQDLKQVREHIQSTTLSQDHPERSIRPRRLSVCLIAPTEIILRTRFLVNIATQQRIYSELVSILYHLLTDQLFSSNFAV